MDITERQKLILKAVISEFIKTADEIGSNYLVEKYGMKVSSATVRNEMVNLMDKGLLAKSHISSGRIPTDIAIRYYIKELIDEQVINSLNLVQIRQGLFQVRFDPEKLIKTVLETLSHEAGAAAFIILDGSTRYHGISNLMNYSELQEIVIIRRILDLLEDDRLLSQMFSKYVGDDIALLIGTELGIDDVSQCSILFTKFGFWNNKEGYIGIIGSRRLDYSYALPVLRYVRDSVKESLKGWA